jgi:hypothetical protein
MFLPYILVNQGTLPMGAAEWTLVGVGSSRLGGNGCTRVSGHDLHAQCGYALRYPPDGMNIVPSDRAVNDTIPKSTQDSKRAGPQPRAHGQWPGGKSRGGTAAFIPPILLATEPLSVVGRDGVWKRECHPPRNRHHREVLSSMCRAYSPSKI